MKLMVLSDFHGNRSAVKKASEEGRSREADALLVCGDITHFGDTSLAGELLKELAATAPTMFVPGNCDPGELAGMPVVEGAVNLHGRCQVVGGLAFIGVGGSARTPFCTPFELAEERIGEVVGEAYRELDEGNRFVLVSHSPPVDTKLDITAFGVHAGSRAVRRFIEERQPSLGACGHIHEARGTDRIGRSLILNPGPARHNFYALVNVDNAVTVELASFQ